eukprot:m.1416275 g.1416275  ORF g.1416275 m.1416275 type:complete len:869 (+) comp25029_c0_seq123:163-2769(+)
MSETMMDKTSGGSGKHSDREAWDTLDDIVDKRQLVDLHSHLLGMGDSSFWVFRIMCHCIPKLRDERSWISDSSTDTGSGFFQEFSLGKDKKTATKNKQLLYTAILNAVSQLKYTQYHAGDGDDGKYRSVRVADIPNLIFSICECTDHTDVEKPLGGKRIPTADDSLLNHVQDCMKILHPELADLPQPTCEDIDKIFGYFFTTDVIYPFKHLCKAFGISLSKYQQPSDCIRDILGSRNFTEQNHKWIVFDARNRKFKFVQGLSNDYFVDLIRGGNMEVAKEVGLDQTAGAPANVAARVVGLLRNSFSFCAENGQTGRAANLVQTRGSFTPEFYPRRYILKDAIYESKLEVLGFLVNHVAERYASAGVDYVELSIGINDVLNPDIWYYLVLGSSDGTTEYAPVCHPQPSKPKPTKSAASHAKTKKPAAENGSRKKPKTETKPTIGKKATNKTDKSLPFKPKPFNFRIGYLAGLSRCRINAIELQSGCDEEKLVREDDTELPGAPREMLCNFGGSLLQELTKSKTNADALANGVSTISKVVSTLGKLVDKKLSDKRTEKLFNYFYDSEDGRLVKLLETISKEKCETPFEYLKKPRKNVARDGEATLSIFLHNYLVGLDVMGDEIAQPFSPLSHSMVTTIVKTMWSRGMSGFGVRLHAMESLPYSTQGTSDLKEGTTSEDIARTLTADPQFLHALVTYRVVRRTFQLLPQPSPSLSVDSKRFRIGHGTHLTVDTERCSPALQLVLTKLCDFVKQNTIVLEVNVTSNHVLLCGTGLDASEQINDVYAMVCRMLELDLPIIFCTDNDGIWPIAACIEHEYHRSVAHQFCVCMMNETSSSKFNTLMIRKMVYRAQKAWFMSACTQSEWLNPSSGG